MARTARIIIPANEDAPVRRRFLAGLCFFPFIQEFVIEGTRFWRYGLASPETMVVDPPFWSSLLPVLASIVLYLCGRSLWRSGRFFRGWLKFASGVWAIWMMIFVYESWPDRSVFGVFPSGNAVKSTWLFILLLGAAELPMLVALLLGLWLDRQSRKGRWTHYQSWAILAMVWCAFEAITIPFAGDMVANILYGLSPPSTQWLVLAIVVFPVAVTGIFLLFGLQFARLSAIGAGAVIALTYASMPWSLSRMVAADVGATLLTAHSWEVLPSPFPLGCYLLNEHFFKFGIVGAAMQAAPWLWIAYYMRRYGIRLPADDGSGSPEKYCGNCHYNLRGLTSGICPECGAELVAY